MPKNIKSITITSLEDREKKWQQNSVNNFFFTNDARKWREKWRLLDFDWLHTLPDCLIVTFHWSISISPLKVLSIGKSGFKSQNLDLRIFNRTQNLKTDFFADFIYWNPPSHGFPLSVIREKIPFRDFVLDWKSEGPDLKIQIRISQSRAPLACEKTPKCLTAVHYRLSHCFQLMKGTRQSLEILELKSLPQRIDSNESSGILRVVASYSIHAMKTRVWESLRHRGVNIA